MKSAAILSPNRIKEVAFNQTRYSQHTPPSTSGLMCFAVKFAGEMLVERRWGAGGPWTGLWWAIATWFSKLPWPQSDHVHFLFRPSIDSFAMPSFVGYVWGQMYIYFLTPKKHLNCKIWQNLDEAMAFLLWLVNEKTIGTEIGLYHRPIEYMQNREKNGKCMTWEHSIRLCLTISSLVWSINYKSKKRQINES